MRFRDRILLCHSNQGWVYQVTHLLDIPFLHVMTTDSTSILLEQLKSGGLSMILSWWDSRQTSPEMDGDSLKCGKEPIWVTVNEISEKKCPIILLCNEQDAVMASEMVLAGEVAGFYVIEPMFNPNQLVITVLKAMETLFLRNLVEERILDNGNEMPRNMYETMEMLQTVREMQLLYPQLMKKSEPVSQPAKVTFQKAEPIMNDNDVAFESPFPEPVVMMPEPIQSRQEDIVPEPALCRQDGIMSVDPELEPEVAGLDEVDCTPSISDIVPEEEENPDFPLLNKKGYLTVDDVFGCFDFEDDLIGKPQEEAKGNMTNVFASLKRMLDEEVAAQETPTLAKRGNASFGSTWS